MRDRRFPGPYASWQGARLVSTRRCGSSTQCRSTHCGSTVARHATTPEPTEASLVPLPPHARACHVCPIHLTHLATAGFSHAELERFIGGVGPHRLRVSRVRRGDVVIRHGEVRRTNFAAQFSASSLGEIPSHPIAQNATFLGIVLGGELGVKLVNMSAIPKRLQKVRAPPRVQACRI